MFIYYLLCNGQLFKVRALPCKVVFRLLIFGFAEYGDVLTHTATQHNKQANEFISVCTSTQALINVAFLQLLVGEKDPRSCSLIK